jgi:putative phosphoribosyl transferase
MFADRNDAGRALAERLAEHAGRPEVVVLGLPRGGVVIAARIADRLGAPLGVVVARKLRCPGAAELAMGAVAVWGEHSATVRIERVLLRAAVSPAAFGDAERAELHTARQRLADWQATPLDVAGRTVIVADDGLATGATMRAALAVLGSAGAARLIAAVPVGARREVEELPAEVVCLDAPTAFRSVGAHYADFDQVADATVARELARGYGPSGSGHL